MAGADAELASVAADDETYLGLLLGEMGDH